MEKASKILLAIGGGIGAFAIFRYVYKTVSLAQSMELQYEGFIIKTITPQLSGVVSLNIVNKSDLTLTLKNVDIKLFAGTAEVGSLVQSKELDILPNGKSLIRLNININYDSVIEGFGQIKNIIKTTNDLPIDIIGVADIKSIFGWVKIPLKYSTTGKDLKALYDTYY
jgi:LEA14-like dessication related protein